MNLSRIYLLLCMLPVFPVAAQQDATTYVDPFIGTGAVKSSLSGNNYPGATVPFGMVQLSPDTRIAPDWAQASGYDYNDTIIYGFTHTRLSGTGASDLIDILLMPTSGTVEQAIAQKLSPEYYASPFSHDDELATPGYYRVYLPKPNVNVQLSATTRTGIHHYDYKAADACNLVLDLDHSANKDSWGRKIIQSQIRVVDSCTIEGFRIITGWAKLRKVCYQIKFSCPLQEWAFMDGEQTVRRNTSVINGTALRAIFSFPNDMPKELTAKVAISPVSIENARLNMQAEAPHFNFRQYEEQALQAWEKELNKIEIKSDEVTKRIFYTALYHTLIQPNTFSDVNGEYMTADYTVKQAPKNETVYTTFSLWDTYRAAHPFYTLLYDERVADFVNSLMLHYDAYGYLPIWQLWGQDNYCMIGNHSIPVIVDALLKSIPGIDTDKAYEAVKVSSTVPHPNSPFDIWERYGYMPENLQTQSVSITLELAYDDWCVAQLAKKLGKEADYTHFMKRSASYRNLFNPESGFFQSKNDKGEWIEPFDPYKYGANGGYPFTEGNAWQYFWYVPQNIPDLIALTGGNKAFVDKLDTFFTTHHQSGELNDNASGFVGQYAHGNEPSHHVAYLYTYAGEAWKTQKYVAHIMKELYNTSSSGYAGNDDCGEMSVWYIFGALGFYPVNPANGEYVIGTPMLNEAVIHLSNGKDFTVKAPRKKANEIYIRSMKLNGKKFTGTSITHRQLMDGGTLEFVMSSVPFKR